jgi:hypothetical protein
VYAGPFGDLLSENRESGSDRLIDLFHFFMHPHLRALRVWVANAPVADFTRCAVALVPVFGLF